MSHDNRAKRDEIVATLDARLLDGDRDGDELHRQLGQPGRRPRAEVEESLGEDIEEELGHARRSPSGSRSSTASCPARRLHGRADFLQPPEQQTDIVHVIRGVIEAEIGRDRALQPDHRGDRRDRPGHPGHGDRHPPRRAGPPPPVRGLPARVRRGPAERPRAALAASTRHRCPPTRRRRSVLKLEAAAFSRLDHWPSRCKRRNARRLPRLQCGGPRVKSWPNGTPLRHRQHPALVLAPLGGWLTGAVLDRAGQRSPKRGYGAGADAAIGFGVLSALPAVAAGLADWVDTYDHPRRVGMAEYALLNSVALSCYGASLALRLTSKHRRGMAKALSRVRSGRGAAQRRARRRTGLHARQSTCRGCAIRARPTTGSTCSVQRADRGHAGRRRSRTRAGAGWCGTPAKRWRCRSGCRTPADRSPKASRRRCHRCPWHQSRFCLRDGRPLQGPARACRLTTPLPCGRKRGASRCRPQPTRGAIRATSAQSAADEPERIHP